MLELHANPLPLAHCSAFAELLQLGIVNAVTLPVELVAFASTEFEACCAIWPSATPFVATDTVTLPVAPLTATPEPATTESTIEDQAGPLDGPFEMTACPAVDPAGFSRVTGTNVAAPDAIETALAMSAMRRRFMVRVTKEGCC
ncbi:hypothetical protein AS149_27635 [Burkholderia cenocepacia]|nr:hypothetical protein AS149_27635 [Burkholderia cenocepacia]